jgi:hypothetical protein
MELDSLKEEALRLDLELEMRDKQVQLLLQSIFDLKSTLLEDEEEKNNTTEPSKGNNSSSPFWTDENAANDERSIINTLEPMDTTL